MADWDGKSKGTAFGYKFLLFVLKNVGVIPVYIFLYPVVFYYFLFSGTFKPTFWYFRKIHKFNILKSIIGVYRNYYSLAIALVDKAAIYSLDKHGFEAAFDGEANLKMFTSGKTGGILLSAHAGSWEMAAHYLKKYNTKVNLVLLQADHERIQKVMNNSMVKMAENVHLNRIPVSANSFEHIFAVREALEKKELITLNADRFVTDQKTITKNFAGYPARFPAGPFQLAAMYRVPVSMVFGFKTGIKKYQLYGIKPLYPEEGEDKKEFTDRAINYYVSNLENMIKKYPYQWYNFYYFWEKN